MGRVLLVGAFLLAGSLIGRADTITTFDLQGVPNDGITATTAAGTLTGTVTIDTTMGVITGVDATVDTTSGVLGVTSETFTSLEYQQSVTFPSDYFEAAATSGGYFLVLDFPVASLVGYSGGPLCTYAYGYSPCDGPSSDYGNSQYGVGFVSGSLTPEVAATPEPSSLALLGSGALGLAGVLRRRRC